MKQCIYSYTGNCQIPHTKILASGHLPGAGDSNPLDSRRKSRRKSKKVLLFFSLIPFETLFFRQTSEMMPPKERHLADRE
jgi:hypothetical protein